MAFAINQNFDLKSRRKDFVRQELTLADLKNTDVSHYPDDYTVTIGGKIYIFNSSNSVDSTLGRWREFAGGGGSSITPGSGLETSDGKLNIKVGSGLTFDSDDHLCPSCPKDDTVLGLNFMSIKIGSANELGIPIGSALVKDSNGKLNVNIGSSLQMDSGEVNVKLGTGLETNDNGVSVKIGSGLETDSEGTLLLGGCSVYRNATFLKKGVIVNTLGGINFKISTGLAVDENGCLYVDVNSITNT